MPSWYRNVLVSWLESSDDVQNTVLLLLYLQVLCGLIGSLGALYTGLVVANLLLALFGIIAITSGYQTLGRAYVLFLACLLVLDILWFLLFSEPMREFPSDSPLGTWARLSVAITFYSECAGFSLRLLSALLWIQMYRLGPSAEPILQPHLGDYDHLPRFGSMPGGSPLLRDTSLSNDVLGTTIYDPTAYATLFSSSNQLSAYFAPEGRSRHSSPEPLLQQEAGPKAKDEEALPALDAGAV